MLLVVLVIYEIATLHIYATAVILIIVVIVAVMPRLSLTGSRI